eukprot:8667425-Alexandrium_andersonii.AAC.1
MFGSSGFPWGSPGSPVCRSRARAKAHRRWCRRSDAETQRCRDAETRNPQAHRRSRRADAQMRR